MSQEQKNEPRHDAGRASAEEGLVILDGPDGVAVTMTPDAAVLTANSLEAAAEIARQQKRCDASDEAGS